MEHERESQGRGWEVTAEMAQNCQPDHNEILGQMTNLPQYRGASLPPRRKTEFLAAEWSARKVSLKIAFLSENTEILEASIGATSTSHLEM